MFPCTELGPLAFWLAVSHFFFDYPQQTAFMAFGKDPKTVSTHGVPWYWILLGHCVCHGAGVALVTGSVVLGLCETAAHWLIEIFKCGGSYGATVDQLLHLACKAFWWFAVWATWSTR